MPPMTGRVIAGRYALSSPIGRGAMGVVWRAHDQLLDREVAVKEVVLSAAIGEDERRNAYQRTLREARTAARLSHRGVVTVYDVAEEDGRPWIVMELVPSRSLDELLAVDGAMPALRAGRMGQQLLAALAAAHAVGVLHRDVKPSNVLIATDRLAAGWEERAVLTDFGIAQFEGDPRLTATGMVMGSPGFTAPERIRGGDATPASDLWSLGATIYAAVEGQGPYEQRGGAITTMSAIINEDAPVAPSAGRLGPLIAALLRRDPSARPSASVAARLFAEVLPLLPDAPPHPATVRSSHVPSPADAAAVAPGAGPNAASARAADAEPAAVAGDGMKAAAVDAAAVAAAAAVGAAGAVAGAAVGAGARAAADDKAAPAGEAVQVKAEAPADHPVTVFDPSPAGRSQAPPGGGPTVFDRGTHGDGDGKAPAGEPAAVPPADSKLASAPPPTERSVPLPPPVPLAPPAAAATPAAPAPPAAPQQKPTFTASKPADQARPSFGASRPAPGVPPQPPSAFSAGQPNRRADPPTMPEPAYESPFYASSNTPYANSGGQYGGGPDYGSGPGSAGAQYAGPSSGYSDLARQYAAGSGGRAVRPRRRGRMIGLVAAAVVVAAAAGGGAAYALHKHKNSTATPPPSAAANSVPFSQLPASVQAFDKPTSALPAGYTTETVHPSDTGTTAGFSIDVPPGWTETQSGLVTKFKDNNGDRFLEVDMTPHTYDNMINEAKYIERQSVATGKLPGYQRAHLEAVPVRGANGAFWQFTWTPSAGVLTRADDILFIDQTANGQQSYAVYFRAANKGWNAKYLPVFETMLHTFQVVTS